jgi:hypothetical protein
LGILEKLLANPYAGDGTIHLDTHLIYIDEVSALFKLVGLFKDGVRKKVFPLSLGGGKHCHGIGYWMNPKHGTGTD